MLDAAHMVKLIRNVLATQQVIYDANGAPICWNYIEKLHAIQESDCFHLANKMRRKALYSGKNTRKIHDVILLPCGKKIPILKNGSCLNLQPIRLDKVSVLLQNTCAYDSIFQIILSAVHDYPFLRNKVWILLVPYILFQANSDFDIEIQKTKIQVEFFSIIETTATRGIKAETYKSRAEILSKKFKPLPSAYPDLFNIECQTSAGVLATFLFANAPSIQEMSACENVCTPRHKHLHVIQLDSNTLEEGL